MLGKVIAENLRNNRDKWGRHRYADGGKYCVIGLKLKELGINVEKWSDEERNTQLIGILIEDSFGFTQEERELLSNLQKANDGGATIENVIRFVENEAETDFPLEKLAKALKR